MILQEKEGVQWLEFKLLQPFPHIAHGVFLRNGGVSHGECFSLNVGPTVKDSPENVKINRQKVKECLGINSLVMSRQCHEDHVLEVDVESSGVDVIMPATSADGLFTKRRCLGLTTYHADCQAALFYDPKQEIIANVHCGWKGNVQNILGKAVAILESKAQCNPKDLLVCISPSLGPNHAEFVNYIKEFPESFYPYQYKSNYFNLWEISYQQLLGAGIEANHIEMAHMCTYEHEELFFSYRRDKTTGRNATVIGFRESL